MKAVKSNQPDPKHPDENFWFKHYKQFKSTTLTKASYARKHKLTTHRFLYWCQKFEKTAKTKKTPSPKTPDFIPIKLTQAPASDTPLCTVELANGQRLTIHHEVGLKWLLSHWGL